MLCVHMYVVRMVNVLVHIISIEPVSQEAGQIPVTYCYNIMTQLGNGCNCHYNTSQVQVQVHLTAFLTVTSHKGNI